MLRVRDSMTREVVTLGPEASAAEAWSVCQELGIRHLPIVEGGRLVGLVSDRDLRDVSPPRCSGGERDTLAWVRLREASSYVPLERLALSPQCGFATSIIGNAISVEDEEYKLRTIVETAEKVWG